MLKTDSTVPERQYHIQARPKRTRLSLSPTLKWPAGRESAVRTALRSKYTMAARRPTLMTCGCREIYSGATRPSIRRPSLPSTRYINYRHGHSRNHSSSVPWNVRPDLVKGHDNAVLPPEFSAATEGRSMLSTWCPQEKVLEHEAVGVFLTHSGWNSSLEGICGGVPMVCWPFFTEQQTNCRYKCTEWGIGMEIGEEVTRAEVEAILREAMEGEKGREMRRRALKLQESAVASARHDGRSMRNVDRLIHEVLLA